MISNRSGTDPIKPNDTFGSTTIQQALNSIDGKRGIVLSKEEERVNQANGQILPFPLEQLEPQYSICMMSLNNMKSMLKSAYKNQMINKSQQNLIAFQIRKIRKTIKYLNDIMSDVGRLKF